MLIVIGYILIGAYMFDELEDFGFGNAAYFCVITLTTIGMCRACTCPKLPGYCPRPGHISVHNCPCPCPTCICPPNAQINAPKTPQNHEFCKEILIGKLTF